MRKCVICGELVEDNVFYCPCCGEFVSITGKNLIPEFESEVE